MCKKLQKSVCFVVVTVMLLSMLCVSVYADDAEEFQRIIRLGDRTAVTYSYTNDAYKKLTTVTYANGDYIEYEYDTSGRVHRQVYDDGDIVAFEYNDQSEFSCITDTGSGLTTEFYFDNSNQLIEYEESGVGFTHTACYTYDESERISSYTDQIGDQLYTVGYTYDTNGRLIAADYMNSCKEYSYDSSNRIIQMITTHNDVVLLTESLTYYDETTEFAGKLASHTYTWRTREIVYTYNYDTNGNVAQVVEDPTGFMAPIPIRYVYDSDNRLIRADYELAGKTMTWNYDSSGNIQSRKEYEYTLNELANDERETVSYVYGDADWSDLLTQYDGATINYDSRGNPLNDTVWQYTWQHGNELTSMFNGDCTWEFTYGVSGLRTKRYCDDVTYNYVYNGNKLVQVSTDDYELYITYDLLGNPMTLTYNNDEYYYVTNAFGDVIAIMSSNSEPVVAYSYDAWGNLIAITGVLATSVGKYNPLRYKGYIYDTETKLYYIGNRYYNPETGRFINADMAMFSAMENYNQFMYCNNNPVDHSDQDGRIVDEVGCSIINAICIANNIAISPVMSSEYLTPIKSWARYGASRSGGRTHKGIDFYPVDGTATYGGNGTPRTVYAMKSGVVVSKFIFYRDSYAVVVDHGDFFALYGEISSNLTVGSVVAQGDVIGTMKLTYPGTGETYKTLMLHLEIFRGEYGKYTREHAYRVDPTYTYSLIDWRK